MHMPVAVSHSIVAPDVIARVLSDSYGLPVPIRCILLSPGINDTYRIMAGSSTYIYRIYRAGWRRPNDIAYELELLTHLHRDGISVAVPIAKLDGTLSTDLWAPEGVRAGVLFSYAPGKVIGYETDGAAQYGRLVARLHTSMDSFQTELPRLQLDLEHLLEHPMSAIEPIVSKQGNWPFLTRLAERLRTEIRSREGVLVRGVCHGDLHGYNVHRDTNGTLTLFDFDCGGPGWRAYDLAVYRWAVDLHAKTREPWDEFMNAYYTERDLPQVDLEAIPAFVAIRTIWLLGLQVEQISLKGTQSVESTIEGGTKALRNWDPEKLK